MNDEKKSESIIGNRAFRNYNGMQCRMWKWERTDESRNRSGYSGRRSSISSERTGRTVFYHQCTCNIHTGAK